MTRQTHTHWGLTPVAVGLPKLVDIVIGLRVPEEQEREDLTITSHG